MQQISNLTAQVVEAARSNSSTPAANTRNLMPATWIATLFAKLQARYGHKWSSSFPADMAKAAMDEWRRGLAGVTGEQVRRGLDTWDSDWPPSLPEFRRACLGQRDDWQHATAAYRPMPPALPRPKADPEVVAAELQRMRDRRRMTPEEIDALRQELLG